MSTRTARYSYRAYPTDDQRDYFAGLFGASRVVYNNYLWQKERSHAGLQIKVLALDSRKNRSSTVAWLNDYPTAVLQQSVRQAEAAYRGFFKGLAGIRKDQPGKPRFKRKSSKQSVSWCGINSISVEKLNRKWGAVRIPKQGSWLKFRLTRSLPSVPKTVTLKKLASGQYEVSFTVQQEIASPKTSGSTAGVDLGLIDLATIVKDDGERYKIAAPKNYRRSEHKLIRLQKAYSRKARGSKNQEKARVALTKQHSRVARIRLDYHRKIAFKLASENQAIGLEDLNLKGLLKTNLAKSVSDAGLGQLVNTIENTGQRLGVNVQKCGRWDPSSQVCSVCGVLDGKKDLSVRQWECSSCGTLLDRDYNAALNVLLLAVGQTESLNARRGSISRQLAVAIPDEARTPVFASRKSRKNRLRKSSLARRAKRVLV